MINRFFIKEVSTRRLERLGGSGDDKDTETWQHYLDSVLCHIQTWLGGEVGYEGVKFPTHQMWCELDTDIIEGDRIIEPKIQKILTFDGIDDYVNCGKNSSLDLNNNDFSICFFVRAEGDKGNILGKYKADGDTGFYASYDNKKFKFYTAKNPSNHGLVETSADYEKDTWYAVVMIRKGKYMRIYVDCEEVAMLETAEAFDVDNNVDFLIGSDLNGDGFFKGRLRRIRIYKRALSFSEISQYCEEDLESTTNLVGWWKCDEEEGTILNDSSGNENNGTIYGATWEMKVSPDVLKRYEVLRVEKLAMGRNPHMSIMLSLIEDYD